MAGLHGACHYCPRKSALAGRRALSITFEAFRQPRGLVGARSIAVRSKCLTRQLPHNASRIANRQTIGWDISGHDATRADSGVASNANSGKDYRVRADPHVIFDDNWCGRRRYLTLFDAMLVPIDDKQVMTQQTVAADVDLFVCRNR
jgi:hypothetical protein